MRFGAERALMNGDEHDAQAMKATGLATSTSEAMRLIQQGGVRVDGVRLDDRDAVMTVGVDVLLQVGRRRVAKVRVQPAQ